jgi:hypothetical protein
MENHYFEWVNPLSIAMLVYQRVMGYQKCSEVLVWSIFVCHGVFDDHNGSPVCYYGT